MTDLWFLTTNAVKLSNFRAISRGTGLAIRSFHERTFLASYSEPRINDRDELLRASYTSALEQWRRAGLDEETFFFIEDTSVIITALSEGREFPGVDVKYWMREMDFTTLDSLLRSLGNDRSVCVRSDIVLHLPPSLRAWRGTSEPYIQFTGITHGAVIDSEIELATNPLRPWQDARSFNKWFVPDGSTLPFSALEEEDAEKADFRRRAFDQLSAFLRDTGINSTISARPLRQLELPELSPKPPLFVISGLSGSGKTTIAEHLVNRYGYMHFEASDFMRYEYHQRLGRLPSTKLSVFAAQILKVEPWTVPEKIIASLNDFGDMPAVVTGFRSEREVEYFLSNHERPDSTVVLLVEASRKLRYDRIKKRGREDAPKSLAALKARDLEQLAMGVEKIAELWDKHLANNGTLRELKRNFGKIAPIQSLSGRARKARAIANELEQSIVRAMGSNRSSEGLTTTQIARLVNKLSLRIVVTQKDNVSRYFNQKYSPYFSFTVVDGKVRYALSQTGRSYYLALKATPGEKRSRARPVRALKAQLELFR